MLLIHHPYRLEQITERSNDSAEGSSSRERPIGYCASKLFAQHDAEFKSTHLVAQRIHMCYSQDKALVVASEIDGHWNRCYHF